MLVQQKVLTMALLLGFGLPAVAAEDPVFTDEYLSEPANIQLGRELFRQQCNKCHGKGAYPGKAPKLKPRKLSADDIYLRITYGFRKMPPWEEIFSDEERMALTAYLKISSQGA